MALIDASAKLPEKDVRERAAGLGVSQEAWLRLIHAPAVSGGAMVIEYSLDQLIGRLADEPKLFQPAVEVEVAGDAPAGAKTVAVRTVHVQP